MRCAGLYARLRKANEARADEFLKAFDVRNELFGRAVVRSDLADLAANRNGYAVRFQLAHELRELGGEPGVRRLLLFDRRKRKVDQRRCVDVDVVELRGDGLAHELAERSSLLHRVRREGPSVSHQVVGLDEDGTTVALRDGGSEDDGRELVRILVREAHFGAVDFEDRNRVVRQHGAEERAGDIVRHAADVDCRQREAADLAAPAGGVELMDRGRVGTQRRRRGPQQRTRTLHVAPQVLVNLQRLFGHGRLAGTGYLSILPVDQGIEHSAGRQSSPRTRTTSTPRTSSSWPSRAAATPSPRPSACSGHRRAQVRPQDPLHREDQPQRAADLPQQVRPDHVRHREAGAADMGAAAVGATIYFGSAESGRQIVEVSQAFAAGPRAGHGDRALVLPAQHRLQEGRRTTTSPPTSPARPTTWASRSRPTSSSRSCPRTTAASRRSTRAARATASSTSASTPKLTSDHPIDLCRYQVANCYMGRIGLINSGGASGKNDFADAVTSPPSSTSAPAAWA